MNDPNLTAKQESTPGVGSSAWLGVMAWISNRLRVAQRITEYASEALRRGDKRAFRAALVPLRIKHFLYRMRLPCRPRILGTVLLILDPVQYELAPHPRPGKPIGLRQILALALVKGVLYRKRHRTVGLPELPDVRIDDSDDGTLVRWLADGMTPNDPSSATRPARHVDCNLDAMAGFAAAHG